MADQQRRRARSFRLRCLVGWLLVAPILGACQSPPTSPRSDTHVLSLIRAEIGEARCTSDAQCRTLPVGHRACGGPERWLAWSTAVSQEERLRAWAAESAALQQARDERSGRMSTCQVIADPGATCQNQRCTLRLRAAPN